MRKFSASPFLFFSRYLTVRDLVFREMSDGQKMTSYFSCIVCSNIFKNNVVWSARRTNEEEKKKVKILSLSCAQSENLRSERRIDIRCAGDEEEDLVESRTFPPYFLVALSLLLLPHLSIGMPTVI